MHKANIVAFIKTNFLRPVLTFANTPFMFFAFFAFFSSPNFYLFFSLYSWGVCTTLRKILDTLDEKPQRNNLSKLGTLKYEFPQLWHSALGLMMVMIMMRVMMMVMKRVLLRIVAYCRFYQLGGWQLGPPLVLLVLSFLFTYLRFSFLYHFHKNCYHCQCCRSCLRY